MERHHRHDHRAHERRAKDSADHGRNERHRKHGQERLDKHSSKIPIYDDRKDRPHLKQSLAGPALSGDNGYVRRWLTQTEDDVEKNTRRSKKVENFPKYEDSRLKAHQAFGIVNHPQFDLKDGEARRKSKRRHNSSSDSSLLEAPRRPISRPVIPEKEDRGLSERQEQATIPHKKRKAETIELDTASVSSQSGHAKETFEKRARHKTKEDRYEPKKKRRKSETVEKKRSGTKPEKKSDRKKAAKKAGEDLVRNFSSKSIGQERLTIRPAHGLGLFKNGLPDLAFSEMEFLQHTDRNAPAAKPDKITSKSREKEKRKVTRVHDEISDFFKPSKNLLKETDPNTQGRTPSTHATREGSIYSKQFTANDHEPQHRQSQFLENTKQRALSLEQGTSPGRISARREPSPALAYVERPPESTSMLSSKAQTYITWSESQFSPGATGMRRQQDKIVQQRSSTPASIRQSLEKTGIYRDTGIDVGSRNSREATFYERERRQEHHGAKYHEKYQRMPSISGTSGSTSSSELPAIDTSKWRADSFPSYQHPRMKNTQYENNANVEDHNEESAKFTSSVAGKDKMSQPAISGDRRIVIEHFNSELGWHQRPSSRAQARHSPNHLVDLRGERDRTARSTPINREQLAKLARIKRPATTLPVSRLREKKNSDKDNHISVGPQGIEDFVEVSEERQTASKTVGEGKPVSAPPIVTQPNEDTSTSIDTQDEAKLDSQPVLTKEPFARDTKFPENGSSGKGNFVPFLANPQNEPRAFMAANPQETFNRTESGSYLGLPMRGGWSTQGPIPTLQPIRSSAFIDPQPVFLRQVQRRHAPEEEYVPYATEPINGHWFQPEAPNLEGTPFADNHPPDLLNYQEGVETEEGAYNDQVYPTDYEQVDDFQTYAHEASGWEPDQEFVESGLEDFEIPLGETPETWHRYRAFEDLPAEQDYMLMEEPVAHGHQTYDDNDTHPIQRFWRPHRQY
ncbi:hypothetical protein LSUE1_G009563 [Lachnellula suecica]|uniref:Uncharacterized protein n=1 Tax=Lachnellula suecica TaxID=602035 RepID=A0A8T9BV62_9HELO|nr:hypothetical protein LSUE1_G009563 [Lachnellula suecica]